MMKIYNTLTQKKEEFQTITPGVVTMYVCGVTVYDSSHIGHAMSGIVFDVVRRYLEFKGYQIRHVVNFTDVDDKIIKRSVETGETWQNITQRYIDQFLTAMDGLNVKRATIYPRATQEIEGIIGLIQKLIDKGFAYAVDGDVNFRVLKRPNYPELKHQNLASLEAGVRVEIDPRKEHPMDFALWKAAKPGEPSWASQWGEGRPGWHIECSEMVREHLGERIHIHGGGSDLIFPHHDNEIAQSESASGLRPFARYWMHNGMLQLKNKQGVVEKMSKSLGNYVAIDDLLQMGDPDVFRMLVLGSLYRKDLTYNPEIYEAEKRGLENLKSVFAPTEIGANRMTLTARRRSVRLCLRRRRVPARILWRQWTTILIHRKLVLLCLTSNAKSTKPAIATLHLIHYIQPVELWPSWAMFWDCGWSKCNPISNHPRPNLLLSYCFKPAENYAPLNSGRWPTIFAKGWPSWASVWKTSRTVRLSGR